MNKELRGAPIEEYRSAYENDGFAVIRDVFDEDWIEELNSGVQTILSNPGIYSQRQVAERDLGFFQLDAMMHSRCEVFSKLVFDSPAAEIARFILDADRLFFFYDELFYKAPSTTARTQWHQDLPFWPVKGLQIPSVWIALTEIGEMDSAVQYVRGSHRSGHVHVPVSACDRSSAAASGIDICPDYHLPPYCNDFEIVTNTLRPGDVLVHHPLVIHGAGPNQNAFGPRIAVSVRYFGPDVRWEPRENTMFFPEALTQLKPGIKMSDQSTFPEVILRG
jgi:ectoine hydroxylase-related dioxygenase (phytanoyl-CoA dioxygenase family)